VGSSKAVLLQTAIAEVYNPKNPSSTLKLRLILDSGSQRSYLTEQIKNTLGLQRVKQQQLSILTFGSSKRDTRHCEVVRIGIATRDGQDEILELLTVPHICEPLAPQPIDLCSTSFPHLSSLMLADTHQSDTPLEVHMLIGSDFYWRLTTGEVLRGQTSPVAINTKLGWVLSGPVGTDDAENTATAVMSVHTLQVGVCDDKLDETLRSFWELESFGVQPLKDQTHKGMIHTIKFKEGRYEISLPWKDFHPPLPDNYDLSLCRLKGLLQRMSRDPQILKEYSTIIEDQLTAGIIEMVDQTDETASKTHYLPHHAVVRRDKETSKVRIVYDASAHVKGPSLNDCLHTGPKFNQKVLDILLRFRVYGVAWVVDIEKAFLMISVSPEDRDVLRFLWVDNPLSANPHIVVYKFTRVVFGVSSSPYLLNSTIQHHLEKYSSSHPELVAKLLESFYVDDLVCGGNNDDDAYEHYSFAKDILSQASFNLRKFVTSSRTLRERVSEEVNPANRFSGSDVTYVDATLSPDQPVLPEEHKVLGVRWNVHSDQLIFELSSVAASTIGVVPTKRRAVSLIGRFYDPLGFLSPITIRFKVMIQELCKT